MRYHSTLPLMVRVWSDVTAAIDHYKTVGENEGRDCSCPAACFPSSVGSDDVDEVPESDSYMSAHCIRELYEPVSAPLP